MKPGASGRRIWRKKKRVSSGQELEKALSSPLSSAQRRHRRNMHIQAKFLLAVCRRGEGKAYSSFPHPAAQKHIFRTLPGGKLEISKRSPTLLRTASRQGGSQRQGNALPPSLSHGFADQIHFKNLSGRVLFLGIPRNFSWGTPKRRLACKRGIRRANACWAFLGNSKMYM